MGEISLNETNKSATEKYAELKLRQEKNKSMATLMSIITIVALVIIGGCTSAYNNYLDNYTFKGKVYNTFEQLMEKYPNAANEIHVDQFKDVNAYIEKFNELNDEYEKELDETVAEYYGISVDEATTIYIEEYMRRHK